MVAARQARPQPFCRANKKFTLLPEHSLTCPGIFIQRQLAPSQHSSGGFQRPIRPATSQIAAKHYMAGLFDRLMDADRAPEPRMPWVSLKEPIDIVDNT